MKKNEDVIQSAVRELKPIVSGLSPIERGKALKAVVAKPALKGKSGVEGGIVASAKPVVKEVIPFGQRAREVEKVVTAQSAYEQRYYMRNYHAPVVNDNMVTHLTSHTSGQIHEIALPEIQKMFAERVATMPERDIFTARHLIDHFNIFGPAQGDICRATFRKLVKDKKMEEIVIQVGRTHRLKYKLLETAAPAKAQK